jgi:hypothetical protein
MDSNVLYFGSLSIVIILLIIIYYISIQKNSNVINENINKVLNDTKKINEIQEEHTDIKINSPEKVSLESIEKPISNDIIKSKLDPPKPIITSQISPRSHKLINVEGIGPSNAEKLKKIQINNTLELVSAGSTIEGIERINAETGISVKLITKWVQRADLMRIQGLNNKQINILEKIGICSVKDLVNHDPKNLYVEILKVKTEENLTSSPPSISMLQRWIRLAKSYQYY